MSTNFNPPPQAPSTTAEGGTDPLAINDDGSAVDPAAFVAAIRADPERVAQLEAGDLAVKAVVYGDDMYALQDLLRSNHRAEMRRAETLTARLAERTIDALRSDAPVPRDTVQLYAQMAASGLQYGPAFRLLRNVHVPLSSLTPDGLDLKP